MVPQECDHRNITPLPRCNTLSVVGVHGPSATSTCKIFFSSTCPWAKFSTSKVCFLCDTPSEMFVAFTKRITVGPCQKSGVRQQCCDNPRVKGVNTRREFHAWQVLRMAPVFYLFTHANERYADEQISSTHWLHSAGRTHAAVAAPTSPSLLVFSL